jgi:TPR repeat protein
MRVRTLVAVLCVATCLGTSTTFAQPLPPAPDTVSKDEAARRGIEAVDRKDYATALQWFRISADQGSMLAQFELGRMYFKGWGVPEDNAQAAVWWRKAAEQGLAPAQYLVGWTYLGAFDRPKNYPQALIWLRKAADQGNADAQEKLGWMYNEGVGVAKDDAVSLRWYRKAADQGQAEAQQAVGTFYRDGLGVPRDYAQAVKWFRLAAEKGDAFAQIKVGGMYLLGQGVAEDHVEALSWFRKAAEQGHAGGQLLVGEAYLWGNGGVPKNLTLARDWLVKSAAQGNEKAKARLAELDSSAAPVGSNRAASSTDVQAAFQFLQRQGTIDESLLGNPEPGLASMQAIGGNICRIRCGYHQAIGLQAVADIEVEISMTDVAVNTLRWDIDRNDRGFISFSSTLGTPVFRSRGRGRKVEVLTFKPLSDWSKWTEWMTEEKASCRVKPRKNDMDRVLRAFSLIAISCGAREAPF